MNDQEQENQRIHLICLFCSQELTLFRKGYQIHCSKILDKITVEKKKPAKILAVAFSDCEGYQIHCSKILEKNTGEKKNWPKFWQLHLVIVNLQIVCENNFSLQMYTQRNNSSSLIITLKKLPECMFNHIDKRLYP